MAKTILITVNSKNKINVPLRCLETILSPGDRIVFLAACQRSIIDRLSAHVSLMQTGLETPMAWEEHRARLLWNEQRACLEQSVVEPARTALSRLGVEVDVNLYSGSLNRTIKRYQETGEVVLILVSPWSGRLKIVPMSAGRWFVWRRSRYPSIPLRYSSDHVA
jgi:hypothetical protein